MGAPVPKGPCWTVCKPQVDGTVRDVQQCGEDYKPAPDERVDYWPDGWPHEKALLYTPEAHARHEAKLAAQQPVTRAELAAACRAAAEGDKAKLAALADTLEGKGA